MAAPGPAAPFDFHRTAAPDDSGGPTPYRYSGVAAAAKMIAFAAGAYSRSWVLRASCVG
jgi:hypothetical protein